MLSVVKSIVLQGLDGIIVKIEVDISNGLPAWDIIGLADTSIKEAKERVRTSIKNCGIDLLSRKYVINLSPANLRKEGSSFDLAIAIGILKSIGIVKESTKFKNTIFIGELSLNGNIEKIDGVLPMCIEALKYGIKEVIVPKSNELEALCVSGINVIGVSNLKEVVDYLNGKIKVKENKINKLELLKNIGKYQINFNEVKGQTSVKRALEVAVARES